MPYTSIAKELEHSGLSVTPHFLVAELLDELREDLEGIKESGRFEQAGIGKGEVRQVAETIRRNQLYWLDRDSATPAQTKLWKELDLLKQAFNRTLFLGLNDFEGHYASYPAGGFYKRHLDTFKQDPARVVSIILYLNRDWIPAHGGELRVYGKDSFSDVSPRGGTLACFMSSVSEHEVLESHAERLSFTGWFKR